MKKYIVFTLLISTLVVPTNGICEEVNDLIETILESSPKQRANVSSYKKVQSAGGGNRPRRATVPNMGIPASKLLEVGAKFPKNTEGFYVYGPVTLKTVRREETGELCLPLWSRNGRLFLLYTRDPQVLAAFNGGWGSRYVIPKECPLKIIGKEVIPGWYAVRLPFDKDMRNYTLKEKAQESSREIGGIFQETVERMKKRLQSP